MQRGDLPNSSYRSLEALCRAQAAITSCPDTRRELERMAIEYKASADWLDWQRRKTEEMQ
jgi:hypothetical protein